MYINNGLICNAHLASKPGWPDLVTGTSGQAAAVVCFGVAALAAATAEAAPRWQS